MLQEKIVKLPADYLILPFQLVFWIPEFTNYYYVGSGVQSPENIEMDDWYDLVTRRIINCLGKEYLPICRLSDGEFNFLFGDQPPSKRYSKIKKIEIYLRRIYKFIKKGKNFTANTLPGISSGNYTKKEVEKYRDLIFPKLLKNIAERGILAIHLSYGNKPFQEEYFPSLAKFMGKENIKLNTMNYIPFYFVYALLRGEPRKQILMGRKILVVHSATGDKRKCIEKSLMNEEQVADISWLTISSSKSMLDILDLSMFINQNLDIVLLGAGIGKINLFNQLSILNIPVLDAGFVFEVWADPANAAKRVFMIQDVR